MGTTEDMVNHPKHYTQYKHEVIELTSCFDFVTGNAVKYLLRAADKNGVEDLEKAVWYLNYGAENPEDTRLFKPCGVVELAETYGNPIVTDLVRDIYQSRADYKEDIATAFKRASDQVATLIKFTKIIRSKEEQKKAQDAIDDASEFLHCGDNAKSLWKWRVTSVTY